jgi:pimeloyl-ACP methyl ester carboxylesterase
VNPAASELALTTPAGRFGGLAWRNPGAPRVLCLHGWLDNAASFLPLAGHLGTLDLVALDFAGHGHSQHRPRRSHYYFMENLWDVEAVLDALEWGDCTLLGHSLGGALACTFATAAPDRVRRLMLLDGLGPVSGNPADTVQRLRKSRESVRKAVGKLREFDDIEAAISARRAVSELSREAAEILCKRSLEAHQGHFRWRTDPGLRWHSPTLLTEAQVLAILGAIEVPTLSITARPLAPWIEPGEARRRLDAVPNCVNRSIEGHHHFHMEEPAPVARMILEFLQNTETEDVPSQS